MRSRRIRPVLNGFRLECARRRLPLVDIWHQPCSFPARHDEVLAAMDGTRDQGGLAGVCTQPLPGAGVRAMAPASWRAGACSPDGGALIWSRGLPSAGPGVRFSGRHRSDGFIVIGSMGRGGAAGTGEKREPRTGMSSRIFMSGVRVWVTFSHSGRKTPANSFTGKVLMAAGITAGNADASRR